MRFVLVHGACVGGWCFDRLAAELSALDHEVVAPDLPGHGARSGETATLQGYADAVIDQLQPGDVLVGYSMGGWVTPLAVDRKPGHVSHIVYLAAAVHREGLSMGDSMVALTRPEGEDRTDSYLDIVQTSADGNFMLLPEFSVFHSEIGPDLTEEDARYIYTSMTPQSLVVQREEIRTPAFWASDIPRSYIGYVSDNCVPQSVGQAAADVLGVEPRWLEGSHFGVWTQAKNTADAILKAVKEGSRHVVAAD
jgi:pimeloyl-ACP methyl ester carboxylesterase